MHLCKAEGGMAQRQGGRVLDWGSELGGAEVMAFPAPGREAHSPCQVDNKSTPPLMLEMCFLPLQSRRQHRHPGFCSGGALPREREGGARPVAQAAQAVSLPSFPLLAWLRGRLPV